MMGMDFEKRLKSNLVNTVLLSQKIEQSPYKMSDIAENEDRFFVRMELGELNLNLLNQFRNLFGISYGERRILGAQ